jgi:hypothetical protein
MAKWIVDVYFSARGTVEVEADSYLEAREKGLEMVEEPNEDDFSVEEVECYKIREGEEEE